MACRQFDRCRQTQFDRISVASRAGHFRAAPALVGVGPRGYGFPVRAQSPEPGPSGIEIAEHVLDPAEFDAIIAWPLPDHPNVQNPVVLAVVS